MAQLTDGRASRSELRRRGWTVNPKRVYRLMREDNLLCVRKRKFVVTTDSNHGAQGLSEPGAGHGADRRSISSGGPISPTSGCATSSCFWP